MCIKNKRLIFRWVVVFMMVLFTVSCQSTSFYSSGNDSYRQDLEAKSSRAMQRGDYVDAENHLLRLKRLFPNDFKYKLELSYLYFRTGEYLKAERLLTHVNKSLPDSKQAWELLALVYLRLATHAYVEVNALDAKHRDLPILTWLLEIQTGNDFNPSILIDDDKEVRFNGVTD